MLELAARLKEIPDIPTHFVLFGKELSIYTSFYVLGFLTIFVFNTFYAKKFNIKASKGLLLTVISYLLIFGWAYVLSYLESLLTDWGHHNAVRVYVWMPLLLFLLSFLMKYSWREICDYIAPSACFVYGIARLGCLFPGCCYGIPYEGFLSVYSNDAGYFVFPVQLMQALSSLLLGVMCLILNAKKKYKGDAKTYFIMLIPYGLLRFIWEFFADNDKVIWGLSSFALHALLMSAVGAVMLAILSAKDKRAAAPEQKQ